MIKKIKVNFRLPKSFKILELFIKRIKVKKEARVYKTPTYFSLMNRVKKTELIYAEIEICKAKINDKIYILLIFIVFIYILNKTGITIGRLAVFWKRNFEILSPRALLTTSKFIGFISLASSSIVFLIIRRTWCNNS